jgi:hypothetical protein
MAQTITLDRLDNINTIPVNLTDSRVVTHFGKEYPCGANAVGKWK